MDGMNDVNLLVLIIQHHTFLLGRQSWKKEMKAGNQSVFVMSLSHDADR